MAHNQRKQNENSFSIWSVDRIGRLIVGIFNILLIVAVLKISSYFLIGLFTVNMILVFTSVTDRCLMRNLLKKFGAKEREYFFNSNGELIKKKQYQNVMNDFENK